MKCKSQKKKKGTVFFSLIFCCFQKNIIHLHIDEHIYSAAQICTHAYTESSVLSPAVSVSAITVREYRWPAL